MSDSLSKNVNARVFLSKIYEFRVLIIRLSSFLLHVTANKGADPEMVKFDFVQLSLKKSQFLSLWIY